jgi:hypothetical protein
MFPFIAWLILFVLCWPLAVLALVLYPVFWILTLPLRLLGIAVEGFFGLLKGIIMLPAKMLQRWYPMNLTNYRLVIHKVPGYYIGSGRHFARRKSPF